MFKVIDVKDLVMLDSRSALRNPARLKVFSFEVHNGVVKALVVSEDLHNFLMIKDLNLLNEYELKYFKSYLKDLRVCKIPCGPYNTSYDVKFALDNYGVVMETI